MALMGDTPQSGGPAGAGAAPQGELKKPAPKSRPTGSVEVRVDECKGCGYCVQQCPPKVLVISPSINRMGYHPARYIGEGCTGCGICFYACPEPGALTVYKTAKAGQPA